MSELDAEDICNILSAYHISTYTEAAMQSDVQSIFETCCAFVREATLGPGERVDFLVGRVAVECKIKGGKNEVLSQLIRYAEHDSVSAIVLVTAKANHRKIDGTELSGKRVHVVWVSGI